MNKICVPSCFFIFVYFSTLARPHIYFLCGGEIYFYFSIQTHTNPSLYSKHCLVQPLAIALYIKNNLIV
jgi:hypothetical protein